MSKREVWFGVLLGGLLGGMPGVAPLYAETLTGRDACLLEALRNADPGMSVGELRAGCEQTAGGPSAGATPSVEAAPHQAAPAETAGGEMATGATVAGESVNGESATGETATAASGSGATDATAPDTSLVDKRILAEASVRSNPFVLLPHKLNYILPFSYNSSPNYGIYNIPESDFDRIEVKFQLSFKMPVVEDLLGTGSDLYVAYTNQSYWQAYNRDISSPFRETDHEPEIFLVIPNDWGLFGWKNSIVQLGVVHQSNGQSGYLSRSWNRVYADFVLEKGNMLVNFKPWHRIHESNDDNPDISDYYGNYELTGLYKKGDNTFSLMMRNLFDGDGRDTYQLDWSFPMYKRWRGYVQYFNGYGESLVDYNAKSRRIGFGIQLSDWL
ncbi:MAG: phospholipase A [Candidatus Thiodiazotropha sp.]